MSYKFRSQLFIHSSIRPSREKSFRQMDSMCINPAVRIMFYMGKMFHINESVSHSVVSDSLQPHVLQPTRLLCAWNSPGKNTRVGCHSLLQGILLTWGSNSGLLHWQADSLLMNHQGRPLQFTPQTFSDVLLHGKQMGKQWKQWLTLFFWAPKSLQMVIAAMKLKDTYSLEGKL